MRKGERAAPARQAKEIAPPLAPVSSSRVGLWVAHATAAASLLACGASTETASAPLPSASGPYLMPAGNPPVLGGYMPPPTPMPSAFAAAVAGLPPDEILCVEGSLKWSGAVIGANDPLLAILRATRCHGKLAPAPPACSPCTNDPAPGAPSASVAQPMDSASAKP
jgi:hypothetical protein